MPNGRRPRVGRRDTILLRGLTREQRRAVRSEARRLLIIAGAGSGKTDVMARRVAWLVSLGGVPKENVVAFTFTEAAAEELKFRIRRFVEMVTPPGENPTLGGMYVGTIHGFCLKVLREVYPTVYYNYEVLDETARMSLVQRGYHRLLGLSGYGRARGQGQFQAVDSFLRAYDLLNEYDLMDVELEEGEPPADVAYERAWVREASLRTDVGDSDEARAFATSAARYYAYLHARRFLDFSTSQSELTSLMRSSRAVLRRIRGQWTHVVVDEAQDINPVQDELIRRIVGSRGALTAVGDHRQAIYGFRGSRVDLMERWNAQFERAQDGEVIQLPHNFRSTPRIVAAANRWSETITELGSLPNPAMVRGNRNRDDYIPAHVSIRHFQERNEEAEWIADSIMQMVPIDQNSGARHDTPEGDRGICYSDIGLLVRSSTDVRTYQDALQAYGIPAIVRAGPDLFSQPEVLLFLALFASVGGIDEFYGNPQRRGTLPWRIAQSVGATPNPSAVIGSACGILRENGLPLPNDLEDRLELFSNAVFFRMNEDGQVPYNISPLVSSGAKAWIRRPNRPRRVFPQQIYHWMLEEVGIASWDEQGARTRSVMFHLGQFSKLITSIERPGWTTSDDFRYQVLALANWGASKARTEEAPFLVSPDAVTVTTVHSAKGLQFPVVFLADVNAGRFPSNYARRMEPLPFQGQARQEINPSFLADNDNLDNERRLMYVALSRAERYLFITHTGRKRSRFVRQLTEIISDVGGSVFDQDSYEIPGFEYRGRQADVEQRIATSFSDIRYFLECPHDFFLRKVLGFAPTIDQAFGYGKGIHNILREIHTNPRRWAEIADDAQALQQEISRLVESGLFYLRYTTGEPLENMRRAAQRCLIDYVTHYRGELSSLEFEPEREFETLIPEEELLISGAIDLLRLEEPPRVTIVDFKSGERGDENQSGLSEDLMRLQVSLYALAARQELEFEPERGIIRYVGEMDEDRRELGVDMADAQMQETRRIVVDAGRQIRGRRFDSGPAHGMEHRCRHCDFSGICGLARGSHANQGGRVHRRRRRQ